MKKRTRLLVVVLELALLLTLIPIVDARAESKDKKYTLYVGESYTWVVGGMKEITGITVSNKKIVKAEKHATFKERYSLTALKKGKATVTIKGVDDQDKEQTAKVAVTVQPMNIKCKVVQQFENGKTLIAVTNNTKQVFDKVYLSYRLVDVDGEVVKESASKGDYVRVVPGGKAYFVVFKSEKEVDCSASTVKVAGVERGKDSTYKVATKKQVQATVKGGVEKTDTGFSFLLSKKNNLDRPVNGNIYVEIYDEDGELIGVEVQALNNFGKGEKAETTVRCMDYPAMDSIKLVVQAYYTM